MVHIFRLYDEIIALDINSGMVHLLDDVSLSIILIFCGKSPLLLEEGQSVTLKLHRDLNDSLLEDTITKVYTFFKGTRQLDEEESSANDMKQLLEDIEDTINGIVELINQGKLFSDDCFSQYAGKMKKKETIKALCLHVAHLCNLNCDYCFAAKGKFEDDNYLKNATADEIAFHEANKKVPLMPVEVGRAALDFLVANSGSHYNLEVDFFGGEPLLNWNVVKEIVSYGRSLEKKYKKRFRFTLTTNGVALDDEKIEYLNKEMSNVVLSLDGRKEVHDKFRTFLDGKGSYDMIVSRFQKLVEERKHDPNKTYYIRGTFTKENLEFVEDVLHMHELGFNELSMEPVVSSDDSSYAISESDLPKLYDEYERLGRELISKRKSGDNFSFYHFILNLEKGPCIYKRISGCGSGTEYFAVTPWGDLYPCHQFVGQEKFKMGNVFDGIKAQNIRDAFAASNLYTKEECMDCWARFYCSGGCAANAYHSTGDINGIYDIGCKLFRKRIECAMAVEVKRMLEAEGENQ